MGNQLIYAAPESALFVHKKIAVQEGHFRCQ